MFAKFRCILLFVLCLLWGTVLYADFKLMAGGNISKFTGNENAPWVFRPGFQGGFGIEFDITHRTLFEADLQFLQKGSHSGSASVKEKYTLNTMSFPVLVRSKLLLGSSPFAVGGLEFAGIISSTLLQPGEEPVSLDDGMKGFDFGFILGGGYEFKLNDKLFFFVEMRYHQGLLNILSTGENSVRRTAAFILLIGVRS